jgi:hypothetical protein
MEGVMTDSTEMKTMRNVGSVLRSVMTIDDELSPQMAGALLQLACQEIAAGVSAKDTEASHETLPGDVINRTLVLVRP